MFFTFTLFGVLRTTLPVDINYGDETAITWSLKNSLSLPTKFQ